MESDPKLMMIDPKEIQSIGDGGGVVVEDLQYVMLPDGLVGEGEHPDGQVPGDGGVAHVGHSADGCTGLLICNLQFR